MRACCHSDQHGQYSILYNVQEVFHCKKKKKKKMMHLLDHSEIRVCLHESADFSEVLYLKYGPCYESYGFFFKRNKKGGRVVGGTSVFL